MEIEIEDLVDRPAPLLSAVNEGAHVRLVVDDEVIAHIVGRSNRRWISGDWLRAQLRDRAADRQIRSDLGRSGL